HCSAYKSALTAGQGDLGAKPGRCIDEYYHDERQSPQNLGPRRLVGRKRAICGIVAAQWAL
ncbi:MAG: hypothetical protein M0Z50_08500, partial [Planctomycetia bacterium]|nr:hypothetical protein [Planctomycetia bacterium]